MINPDELEYEIVARQYSSDIVFDIEPAAAVVGTSYVPLGYDHENFYYLSRESRQVHPLKAKEHVKLRLLELAPLSEWERDFPSKSGAAWDAAANLLMRACRARGVYNPGLLRGRGAWFDDGRAVLHLGDHLLVDGVSKATDGLDTRFIYEAGAALPAPNARPLAVGEAKRFSDLCAGFAWEQPLFGRLLAGWCLLAPICGALSWRPHIWVTGGAGSGKTWILENIIRQSLGELCLAVQSETTEAGLRQSLGQDAFPVIFDEAEGEDQRAHARIQNVLALMRQASSESGSAIVKGSAHGEALSYRIRSMFAFGSIGVNTAQQADRTRVTVLSLGQPLASDKWGPLSTAAADLLTPDYVKSLHARGAAMIPVIRDNARVFALAGGEALGSQRCGDQLGTLLAGLYALHSDGLITPEKARAWIDSQKWEAERQLAETKDEQTCLARLMTHQLRLDPHATLSVAELYGLASGLDFHQAIGADFCKATLLRIGIRIGEGKIIFSTTHPAIKTILKGTSYEHGWGRTLARLPGADQTAALRFGPVVSRGVGVPQDLFR